MEKIKLSRRQLLQTTATVGGGLVISFYIPPSIKAFAAATDAKAAPIPPPNGFIRIAPDNTITMVINKLEMGQGVNTSMAQLIAEELECDWTKIKSVSSPVDAIYNHTAFGTQMTGGSTALISSWDQHRKIGAAMREMLKAAAAARWSVPVGEVKAVNGTITHSKKGKLTYGELAEEASKIPRPENPPLKDAKDFKIIGKSVKRVDAVDKSNGKAIFGIDVKIPGMMYAMVSRPHLPGGTIDGMDEKAAKKVPGVIDVIKFGDRVAVLAKNTHAAKMGRQALNVKWTNAKLGKLNSEDMMTEFRNEAAKGGGKVETNRGDVAKAAAGAARTISSEFEFPYLAHAAMEPMNCTIAYDGKSCEIWSGHQMPTIDRDTAAKILGMAPETVKVNTVYAGGSFGRRANKASDYVVEAAQLAKVVKKPLKVVWTREDDMRGGYYRPMNYHKVHLADRKSVV